ncbi:MAG: RnfABCDGE type electron transport complex subunit G [Prevotella sp.]|nr:RnfABCDGE type electron transport complex subunit G [Prevotella sp.]MBR5061276.1 RnfABCDGE type electron transport complex subunit G [Prevotella sp.]
MKKIESSLLNMVLVLVGTAFVMGGILAWINHITEGPISQQAELTLANGIREVMGGEKLNVVANDTIVKTFDGKEYTFIIHHAQDRRKRDLGAAVESTTLGFADNLKVLVGFNPEGEILGYTILQSSETPGLGAKADKWFQEGQKGDIIGRNLADKDLEVKKNGGDVDAITASTITSRAFLKAINQAYKAYANKKEVDGHSSASQQVKNNS